MVSLEQIRTEVKRLAATIAAPGNALPTFGYSEDGARPHIEIGGGCYHYVVVERGQELRRDSTQSLDDLLYCVFEAVTFSMAMNFEVAHRVRDQDCRRILFKHQVELLSALSAAWAARLSEGHSRVLSEHPFDDLSLTRAELCEKLRRRGMSSDEAWRKACDRYPLPASQASRQS